MMLQCSVVGAAGWLLLLIGTFNFAGVVHAMVPFDLSNFQNEYVCDLDTLIVRPGSVKDVQEAVARYPHVRSNGRGHSWNRPFFCSNVSDPVDSGRGPAVNIQLTTIRPLRINVLEDEMAVWVDAGVTTIDLIEYLADYVTVKSPTGYTLAAFPWYVYQTIAGAVSTGSHGSSLVYNSLSHQVLEMEMVLANGTLLHLTPETQPFLMRAARVSVGRLGVITRLKMRIVREMVVKRELRVMPVSKFLTVLQAAQQHYLDTGALPPEFNETEWFWQTQRSQILMVTFTRGDSVEGNASAMASVLSSWTPDATTIYNTSLELLKTAPRLEDLPLLAAVKYTPEGLSQPAAQATSALLQHTINAPLPAFPRAASVNRFVKRMNNLVEAFEDVTVGRQGSSVGVSWPPPTPKPLNGMYGSVASAVPLMDANRAGLNVIAKNATLEAHRAYLYQPQALEVQIKGTLYDQYEVSVPVSSMAQCVAGMMTVMYGDDIDSLQESTIMTDKGFRSAPLMRLVGKEEALLAQTGDEPRLFFNIEDYLYYNGGRKGSNTQFKKVVGYLRSSPNCGRAGLNGTGGRLHWGKAGWPDYGCWRGDVEYPETWCDFGCAVQTLDPSNKFVGSAPDRFTWEGVDLATCCGPNGFNKNQTGCTCSVKHARAIEDCPPSPYYTYR